MRCSTISEVSDRLRNRNKRGRKVVLLRTGQNGMNKMENIDISAAILLFEIKLSERSGFVRDVKAAENFLREYELATTTNFCCNKAKKRFGTIGMYTIFDFHIKWY